MIWKLFVIVLAVLGCFAAFATKRSYYDGAANDYWQDRHQCPQTAFLSQLFVTLAESFNNMAQQMVRSPQMLNNQNNHHIGRNGGRHGYPAQRGPHHGYGYHHQPPPHKPFYRAPPPPFFGGPPAPGGQFFGGPPPSGGQFFGRPPPSGGPFHGPPPPPFDPFHGPPPPFVVEAQTPFIDEPWTPFQGRNPFKKNPNPPANPPPFPNPPANPPTFSRPPTFSSPPMFSQTPQLPGSSSVFPQFPKNGNNNWRSPGIGLSKPVTSQLQPPSQPLQPEPQTKDNGGGLDDQLQENSKDIPSKNDFLQSASLDSMNGVESAQLTEGSYSPNSGETGDVNLSNWDELVQSIFDEKFEPTSTISSAAVDEENLLEDAGLEDQQD